VQSDYDRAEADAGSQRLIRHGEIQMKSLCQRSDGLRLERTKSSPLWAGDGFRNIHRVLPGLRDPAARQA
jgi:hypothetical protein